MKKIVRIRNDALENDYFEFWPQNSTMQYDFDDDGNGKPFGTLYIENPLRFEGNAEESAKIFFECCIKEILHGTVCPHCKKQIFEFEEKK